MFLSAAEVAHLDTWIVEIAAQARGEARTVGNGDWRVGANGALIIHDDGSFHDFSGNAHGYGAIELLKLLHAVDQADALRLAQEWLKTHPGDGRQGRDGGDHGDEADVLDAAERLAMIEAIWDRGQQIAGTPAETYLASRGLKPSVEDGEQLRWIPVARGLGAAAEGAIVAALKDNEANLVAIQLTHIDVGGRKSDVKPARVTLRGPVDWNRRGAVRFAAKGGTGASKLVICEGVEDALSARAASAERVWAVLGVGRIGAIEFPFTVQNVVVMRDDDPLGSPADSALVRGLVRLLGRGVKVSVTDRPRVVAGVGAGLKDANDLLQRNPNLVRDLLAGAAKPALLHEAAREAAIDEASRLSDDAYERAREPLAKLINWRRPVLDVARGQRRKERAPANNAYVDTAADEPWPDPVTDIGAVLDAIVGEIARYGVAPDHYHDTIALWGTLAHLLHREDLGAVFSPRLVFQSAVKRCGKTLYLKMTKSLVPRPMPASSLTPAVIYRAVDSLRPTLLVDEADNIFHSNANPDLLSVFNSGHDRGTAYVPRNVPNANKGFDLHNFNTFTGMALTIKGKIVHDTVEDRSIVLRMRRKTKSERRERFENNRSTVLLEAGRKLARWAADLTALPVITLPDALYNRVGDNWTTMSAVAELAGGSWPARARAAAVKLSAETDEHDKSIELLEALWRVYRARGLPRMHTAEIAADLLDLDDGKWREVYHGRPVTAYCVREWLEDFLPENPERIAPRRWREGSNNPQWGYHELHWEDAWTRYLGLGLPSQHTYSPPSPKSGLHPTHSTQLGEIDDQSDTCHVSDGVSDDLHTVPDRSDPSAPDACADVSNLSSSDPSGTHPGVSGTPSDTPNNKKYQDFTCDMPDVSDEDGSKGGVGAVEMPNQRAPGAAARTAGQPPLSVLAEQNHKNNWGPPRGAKGRRRRGVGDAPP